MRLLKFYIYLDLLKSYSVWQLLSQLVCTDFFLVIITFRFTCCEMNNWQDIYKFQIIMNTIISFRTALTLYIIHHGWDLSYNISNAAPQHNQRKINIINAAQYNQTHNHYLLLIIRNLLSIYSKANQKILQLFYLYHYQSLSFFTLRMHRKFFTTVTW